VYRKLPSTRPMAPAAAGAGTGAAAGQAAGAAAGQPAAADRPVRIAEVAESAEVD
jgi:hypothetical protein